MIRPHDTSKTGTEHSHDDEHAKTAPYVAQGSSTGSPGVPYAYDRRNAYDPRTTAYNSATGSGYSTATRGQTGSVYDDHHDNHDDAEFARYSKTGRASERAGSGIAGAISSIHVS